MKSVYRRKFLSVFSSDFASDEEIPLATRDSLDALHHLLDENAVRPARQILPDLLCALDLPRERRQALRLRFRSDQFWFIGFSAEIHRGTLLRTGKALCTTLPVVSRCCFQQFLLIRCIHFHSHIFNRLNFYWKEK